MGKRVGKTKIRAMSPEAIAAKEDARLRTAVNDVGNDIGVPVAQRGHHSVEVTDTTEGLHQRVGKTLRKLTRVDRLHRSGAIDDDQVKAIDLYVKANEAAYGTCLKIGSYGDGGGGSSPTGAAAAAHGRQLDRIGDAWRYDRARSAIPGRYLAPFERIVLDNHPIGAVGADMWPAASAASVSGAIRDLVRTCADALLVEFAAELGVVSRRTEMLKTMQRMDAAVRSQRETTTDRPVSNAVLAALPLLKVVDGDTLFVAPAVIADLMRENGLTEAPEAWYGFALVVIEHWQFGWVVRKAPD